VSELTLLTCNSIPELLFVDELVQISPVKAYRLPIRTAGKSPPHTNRRTCQADTPRYAAASTTLSNLLSELSGTDINDSINIIGLLNGEAATRSRGMKSKKLAEGQIARVASKKTACSFPRRRLTKFI
jgi:hypothetical protein